MIFETNTAFQKFVINQCVDFRQACLAYGVNINASKSGVCYCPFHYNRNTPSAKVYSSNLYCFSEHKSFSVSDLFDYDLVDDTILNAFSNIWNIVCETKKNELKSLFEKVNDGSIFHSIKKEFLPLLDYKRNKITYSEYCQKLLTILNNMR